jgi:enamine deaminase RidA (YjgF/YER057c/UK114 family)
MGAKGAKFGNVVKWNEYIVVGQNPQEGFAFFSEKWRNRSNPNSPYWIVGVMSANPEWLVEIEAIAGFPE